MLILTESLLKEIEELALANYPQEGCGLLLGNLIGGENRVQMVYPVPNSWEVESEKVIRFRIDDRDMLDAEFTASDRGLDVIGVFHSHPEHPPIASTRDLSWATWPGYSYLITEVRSGKPGVSRSWQLRLDRTGFDEEEIIQQDNTKSSPTG
jgi:proteasome lid subunit RPN8/RPN11